MAAQQKQFSNPPLWVLKNTILPGGGRLEKAREEWKEPIVIPPARRGTGFVPTGRVPPTWRGSDGQIMTLEGNKIVPYKGGEFAVIKSVPQGNLENGEYFQWIGAKVETSGFARCRACNYTAWNEQARNAHKNGCGKILQDAYTLLRKDVHRPTGRHLCAVCSQAVDRVIWGVPLCFGNCEDFWRFGGGIDSPRISNMLKDAIQLVRFNKGAK